MSLLYFFLGFFKFGLVLVGFGVFFFALISSLNVVAPGAFCLLLSNRSRTHLGWNAVE